MGCSSCFRVTTFARVSGSFVGILCHYTAARATLRLLDAGTVVPSVVIEAVKIRDKPGCFGRSLVNIPKDLSALKTKESFGTWRRNSAFFGTGRTLGFQLSGCRMAGPVKADKHNFVLVSMS
jgi:hypothetical protein